MKNTEKIIWNVNGGQVNIAYDNALLKAVQNNSIITDELDEMIRIIKDNLESMEKEKADILVDAIDMAKEELSKPEPSKTRLKSCVALIAPMLTIANNIPALTDNLRKFSDFIIGYIR